MSVYCFGTPDLLDRAAAPATGRPVAAGIEYATSWEFPSREALRDACRDRAPGRFYPRYGHASGMFAEARLAQLEGAAGSLLYASGVAALASVFLGLVGAGGRIALSRKCYGGTVALGNEDLPRLGIHVDWFDPFDDDELGAVLARSPAHVHVETPVNPTGRVFDLGRLARRTRAAGATLSVDATFMPPPFQRTLELGADLAVHSATKFLGGHTDVLAGAVSGADLGLLERLERFRRRLGPILGPDAAWRLHRSLETLELRMRRHCETAARVAVWLDGEGRDLGVAKVHYPGLPGHPDHELAGRQMQLYGAVFAFEPDGGLDRATRIFDGFEVFRRAVSLGGVESLASMPIDTSHHMVSGEQLARLGFAPSAIRLSIGLEPFEVLRDDLARALS